MVRKILFISCTLFLYFIIQPWSLAAASTARFLHQTQGQAKPKNDANTEAFLLAIRDLDKDAFKSLIKQADINASNAEGVTALMLAIRAEEPSFVKALLEKGAKVDAGDKPETTPLLLAVNCTHEDDGKEITEMLIKHKADVNAKTKYGTTPLMQAASKGRLTLVKLLLEKGANLNDEHEHHATALTYAIRSKQTDTFDYLKSVGATGPEPEPEPTPKPGTINQRPVSLNSPAPQYTEEARQHKIEGSVTARVLVDTDGSVKRVVIIRGLPYGLSDQAIRAASELKFKPAIKEGQPVLFWVQVHIEFHLRKK